MRKFLLAIAALGVVTVLMVFAVGALADDGHGKGGGNGDNEQGKAVFASTIVPSVPTDPKIDGVAAAGAPWVIGEGKVTISGSGDLKIEVEGLIITAKGGNPLTTISASLFCGAATTATATTAAVPFSPAGDAEIEASVMLPAKCLAPVVFLHPGSNTAAYIAASGF